MAAKKTPTKKNTKAPSKKAPARKTSKNESFTIKKTHFYAGIFAVMVIFAGLGGYALGSNGGSVKTVQQEQVESVTLNDLAEELDLDMEAFQSCRNSGKYEDEIGGDLAAGIDAGVSGTPTFFIGNEQDGYIRLVGAQPYSTIRQVIEAELDGASSGDRVMVSTDDDPVLGEDNAPVTVIEFSDFECPFCGRAYGDAVAGIKRDYIESGQVKFVYRDFPLTNIHPLAIPMAEAANCAGEQGKFWEYHDAIFENQNGLSI